VTLSPVSTHGLVLGGIIGGILVVVVLGLCVLWLFVIRLRKLKANIAGDISDVTPESTPPLNPGQIRTDLQVRNSMASLHSGLIEEGE